MKALAHAIMVAAILACATTSHAHGDLMRLGSTQDRKGQLSVEPDFDFTIPAYVTSMISLGGQTFYSGIIPSFAWVIDPYPAASPVIYPLKSNTQVSVKIVQLAPEASVKVGGTLLNAVDKTAVIGTVSTDPEAHVHPEWELTLPDGVEGDYVVKFKFATTTNPYTESPVYTLTITNRAEPPTATPTLSPTTVPTWTATATPTMTPTASATPSVTKTPTVTSTSSPTITATRTPTLTVTLTATVTPTASPTATATTTATQTATYSPSPTWTQTQTPTASPTPSHTATFSVTATSSPTRYATLTATPTLTKTTTPSVTPGLAATATPTLSATRTSTTTITPSPTLSETPTPTATLTRSPTVTAVPSATPTQPPTPTGTQTATSSVTSTATVSATSTPSPTATVTRTPRVLAADANCNGRVTAADLVAIRLAQLEPVPSLCDADVSGDGTVDEKDLALVAAGIFGDAR